jgi:hypothetical protein
MSQRAEWLVVDPSAGALTMRLAQTVLAVLLLAAMPGTVPAQNTSLDSLDRRLAELDRYWNDLVRMKARLEDPNTLLVADFTEPRLRLVNRDDFETLVMFAGIGGADTTFLMKRADVSGALKRRALHSVDVLIEQWKQEADQARYERASAATAPFFIRYVGSLIGQYRLTCRSSEGTLGNFSEGGPAKLEFLGAGRLGGVWGEGVIQGTIDKNGFASGTARGPLTTVRWSGALTQSLDGSIKGGGAIASPPGSITCTGFWSIP